MVQTSIRLSDDLHDRLRRAAFVRRAKHNDIMIEALTDWLDRAEAGAAVLPGRAGEVGR